MGVYTDVSQPITTVGVYTDVSQPITTVGVYTDVSQPITAVGVYTEVSHRHAPSNRAFKSEAKIRLGKISFISKLY